MSMSTSIHGGLFWVSGTQLCEESCLALLSCLSYHCETALSLPYDCNDLLLREIPHPFVRLPGALALVDCCSLLWYPHVHSASLLALMA